MISVVLTRVRIGAGIAARTEFRFLDAACNYYVGKGTADKRCDNTDER